MTRSPPPSASRVTPCGRARSSLSASLVPSSAASAVRRSAHTMHVHKPHAARSTQHARLTPPSPARRTPHASGGPLADGVGRKGSFAYTATTCAVGAALCASARSFSALLLGRLICGLGIGAALCCVSLFIPEVAPPSQRGFLCSLNQVLPLPLSRLSRLPACLPARLPMPAACLPISHPLPLLVSVSSSSSRAAASCSPSSPACPSPAPAPPTGARCSPSPSSRASPS